MSFLYSPLSFCSFGVSILDNPDHLSHGLRLALNFKQKVLYRYTVYVL